MFFQNYAKYTKSTSEQLDKMLVFFQNYAKYLRYAVDYKMLRVGMKVFNSNGMIRIVEDYKTKSMYIIYGEKCTVQPLMKNMSNPCGKSCTVVYSRKYFHRLIIYEFLNLSSMNFINYDLHRSRRREIYMDNQNWITKKSNDT